VKTPDAEYPLSRFDSQSISCFTGSGAAYCRKHGVLLTRSKNEFASRADLEPGEPSQEQKFDLVDDV
jgi:hypothetical protein